MKIIVCVKQIPASSDIEIDKKTNNLVRLGAPSIINPPDMYAVEAGLKIKEKHGGTVTVITMGRPEAESILRECIAIGADKGYIISDPAVAGSDTLATGYVLTKAIEYLGGADVVLCGKQAYDGDTGQVGPAIAERLGCPQVTYVQKLEIEEGGQVTAQRLNHDGLETISTDLPVLCTITELSGSPRHPTIKTKIASKKAEFEIMTAAMLGLEASRIGAEGSPTQVEEVFPPARRETGFMVQEETEAESVRKLMKILLREKLVG